MTAAGNAQTQGVVELHKNDEGDTPLCAEDAKQSSESIQRLADDNAAANRGCKACGKHPGSTRGQSGFYAWSRYMVRNDYRAPPTFPGCTIGCGKEAKTEIPVFLIGTRMRRSE